MHMSKQLKITVQDFDREEEKVHYPHVDIKPVGHWEPDELAGTLLVAYQMQARNFLDSHNKECTDCPAYKMHKQNLESLQATTRYMEAKYGSTKD